MQKKQKTGMFKEHVFQCGKRQSKRDGIIKVGAKPWMPFRSPE